MDQQALGCRRERAGVQGAAGAAGLNPLKHTFTRAMAVTPRAFPARGNTQTGPSEHKYSRRIGNLEGVNGVRAGVPRVLRLGITEGFDRGMIGCRQLCTGEHQEVTWPLLGVCCAAAS
jgi:hypothetical protein